MPAVSSCIYEYDTCQPERGIIIVNDWELVAMASPKGMAFIFFPEDGSVPWRFDFPGMEGWMVNMPQGRYSMLSFNDDTYNVRFIENEGTEATRHIPKKPTMWLLKEARSLLRCGCLKNRRMSEKIL